ncbi:hypothetical protein Q4F19_07880 [Sphingomonas sp. BIUV-7]|uniref:Uncharacterized protein n=1 Tax=Sphingomonas natans TaxID=3063330 RepID=A0ABT8Y8W8_9SPHN|nr:hypothetical protein [Sphingomonas sp. BIUV-7]MDO6414298.1 hypothetical protein [Sphingomonas sp. BIUV-7]
MADNQDREYFARRAAECPEKARIAVNPAIGKIHRQMTEAYERRSEGEALKAVRRA